MDEHRISFLIDAGRSNDTADYQTHDDEREIRYSLTALGEAAVYRGRTRRPRFAGFGPCRCPTSNAG